MYKKALVDQLKQQIKELNELITEIDIRLPNYRRGSLVIQNDYAYLKEYKDGKMVSTYVGKHLNEDEINDIHRELSNRKTLEKRRKEYVKELNGYKKIISKMERSSNE